MKALLILVNAVYFSTGEGTDTLVGVGNSELDSKEFDLKRRFGLPSSVTYPSAARLAAEHAPMSLEEALTKVPELPQSLMQYLKHFSHRKGQRFEMLQKDGSGDAVEQAREVLNSMRETTEAELDEAVMECKEFDAHTSAVLDTNQGSRADLGAEAASARSEIQAAQAALFEVDTQLAHAKSDAASVALECKRVAQVQSAGLAILEADLASSQKVENMTLSDCSAGDTSLLQCGSGYRTRFKFAGRAAEAFNHFKSAEGSAAVQRAGNLILSMERGLQTPEAAAVNKSAQQSEESAEALRNLTVMATPEPASYTADAEPMKCTVSGSPSCPMLVDAISQLAAEVMWARDQAAEQLGTHQEECQRLAEDSAGQTGTLEHSLAVQNVRMTEATGSLNTAEEATRLKVDEANGLVQELVEHRKACAAKIQEGAETLCGLKSIRQEVYQMQGQTPLIQDCEVGDWTPGECSVECAGGERELTRAIVTPASTAPAGAQCPPLAAKEACNLQPCPIDCVDGEWSQYSQCTKECGGGVQTRARVPKVEPAHGGESCGPASETIECNVNPCDAPCALEPDWSDWSGCSKACGGGLQVRYKSVAHPAGPFGHCPSEFDSDRLEEVACNESPCPSDVVCEEHLDILMLLDGSGSASGLGFEALKTFTTGLLDRLSFGDQGAKAGVILFSGEAELVHDMSEDGESLKSVVGGLQWPAWNTNTAAALTTALTTLANGARSDVNKEKTIVFLITDGNPNNVVAANAAADSVKEQARLVVVPVGNAVDMEFVHRWASWPTEENVLPVSDFEALEAKLTDFVSDICYKVGCRESLTGNGADYVGCQGTTVSGRTCQNWQAQKPQSHAFVKTWFPTAHLGDHNFCRNPDGDAQIWCYTTDSLTRWEFCDPRKTTSLPSQR
jgi:uncharacterized protein YegL